jgi:hypothetical protein
VSDQERDERGEEPSEGAEPETGEVPLGIPVSEEEFRKLKEEAAKPSPSADDEQASAEEDEGPDRDREEGNA